MNRRIRNALTAGTERLTAWADLLDRINVFPVADGDTGRNLVVSLSPLRQAGDDPEQVRRSLLLSARGNSGNIAGQFFSHFLMAETPADFAETARTGRDQARQAVADPKPGTMLTLFDALADALAVPSSEAGEAGDEVDQVMHRLEASVKSTTGTLPELREAGVVDAGALGMFIFFEAFFHSLAGNGKIPVPVTERFGDHLAVSSGYALEKNMPDGEHCVNAVIRLEPDRKAEIDQRFREYADTAAVLKQNLGNGTGGADLFSGIGDSLVVTPDGDRLKIHLHTQNRAAVRRALESLGQVVDWDESDMADQTRQFREQEHRRQPIHIMTDAAGSLTREDARRWGFTLLDSYINVGERSVPETSLSPSELYAAMRQGGRVSTSQASVFERHQHYESVVSRYDRVLYLCVGSVYTGNYETAAAWKREYDPEDRLTVIDTGTASGRLAAVVMATARFAGGTDDPDAVVRFAERAVAAAEEYVFLDRLQYLARGGRLSKTGAFFGDLFHVKPVIRPAADGAEKVTTVRDRKGQVAFAREKLAAAMEKGVLSLVMLEYSDNEEWVRDVVLPEVTGMCEGAEVVMQPLSLTSGAHMGPGTWAVAFVGGERDIV